MGEELAIEVRGVVKSYGSHTVLKGLDMEVPYGSIYGLLGSSGCGKTTLLRCILGQLNIANGHISVLGKEPGSRGHQIPGRDVGYMPQEMALYGDFTMSETLYYFGILHKMSFKDIRARREFLQDFLELPSQSKLIRTLSGGQKRRFSFAIAMLQQPPLMILDEPTVGVDPILRAKIWQHLVEVVSSSRTTIVITTHYIEEARQANFVGLMRDGRLLAEAPPTSLIQAYGLNTLEDVFLQLCRRQDAQSEERTEIRSLSSSPVRSSINSPEPKETTPLIQSYEKELVVRKKDKGAVTFSSKMRRKASVFTSSLMTSCKCPKNPLSCLPHPINIAALCWKNLMRILRNPSLLLFQFFVPTFQIIIFCLAIGRNLNGINIAYANDDTGIMFEGEPFPPRAFCTNTDIDHGLENVTCLGDLFISKLSQDKTFNMIEFDTAKEAIEQVQRGKAWTAIYIGKDFTVSLMVRLCALYPKCLFYKEHISDETINSSLIYMYNDATNLQISVTLQNHTATAYELFLVQLIQSCSSITGVNISSFSSPIHVEQPPVYGRNDLSFTDYMGPGMITSIIFGLSIGLCALAMITERNEGLIDRTWVAGVNITEIIIAQICTQFFILVIQITLLLTVAIFGFKIYTAYMPDFWLIGALSLIQGLTGMSFGLFLSAVCTTENAAVQAAIAIFYPSMLLSGVIWPLEGMPRWLQYISYALPGTFPAQAMRAIMGRGWGLAYAVVWRGFLMSFGWFFLFLFMTGVAFNLLRR